METEGTVGAVKALVTVFTVGSSGGETMMVDVCERGRRSRREVGEHV